MSPAQRALILSVHNGDPRNLPFIYFLCSHRHAERLIEVLKREALTGKILTDFILEKCQGEPIRLLNFCLNKALNVNKAKTPKVGIDGAFG